MRDTDEVSPGGSEEVEFDVSSFSTLPPPFAATGITETCAQNEGLDDQLSATALLAQQNVTEEAPKTPPKSPGRSKAVVESSRDNDGDHTSLILHEVPLNEASKAKCCSPKSNKKKKARPLGATLEEMNANTTATQERDLVSLPAYLASNIDGASKKGCSLSVVDETKTSKKPKDKKKAVKQKSPMIKQKTKVVKNKTNGSSFPSIPKSPTRQRPLRSSPCLLPGTEALASFMDQLNDAGAQKWGVDLPTIVVMGDIGAGKSTLLSLLLRLDLPTTSTTTRCPIRVTMQQSDIQQAHITVASHSDPHAGQNTEFPARKLVKKDWAVKLPQAIADAQEFIQNRQKQGTNDDVINLHVMGPEYLDISVVDLPGIVRPPGMLGKEEKSMQSDIAQMYHEYYLSQQRSLIVAIQPASIDWQMSQITADVLAVDPDSERTIVCLTKPDLMDQDAESEVVDVMNGEGLKFRHLHVTKCHATSKVDRDLPGIEERLKNETLFFENHGPWKFVTDRNRLGVESLRVRLGELLMEMVRASISSIQDKVCEQRATASLRRDKLGARHVSLLDKQHYVQEKYRTILGNVESSIAGKNIGDAISTATSLHADCTQFRERVMEGTLATVRKIDEGYSVIVAGKGKSVPGEVVHLDEKYACVDFVCDVDRNSDLLFDHSGMKAPQDIEENDVWAADDRIFIARKDNYYDVLRKIPLGHIRRNPSWLQQRVAGQKTDNLHCFLNPQVFNSIVVELIETEWEPHAMRMLELVERTANEMLTDAVSVSFIGDTRYKDLPAALTQCCKTVLRDALNRTRGQINDHFAREKHPYTQDAVFFEQLALGRHTGLQQQLTAALELASPEEGSPSLIVQTIFDRQKNRTESEFLADELENTLHSYGIVAARRVSDHTPMLFWQMYRNLPPALAYALSALEPTMEENPKFVSKLRILTEEIEELDRVLQLFDEL